MEMMIWSRNDKYKVLFHCTFPLYQEMPREDFVRRSSRIQNKDGDRERGRERLRKMINEEGEEEEEEGAVTYVPKGDPKKM